MFSSLFKSEKERFALRLERIFEKRLHSKPSSIDAFREKTDRKEVVSIARGKFESVYLESDYNPEYIADFLLYWVKNAPYRDLVKMESEGSRNLIKNVRAIEFNMRSFIQVLAQIHDLTVDSLELEKRHRWHAYVKRFLTKQDNLKQESLRRVRESLRRKKRLKRRISFGLKEFGGQIFLVGVLGWALLGGGGHSFFVFLRFSCFSVMGVLALSAHKKQNELWRNIFAIGAIAYNPFLPLDFEREWWEMANYLTIGVLLASIALFRDGRINPVIDLSESTSKREDLSVSEGKKTSKPESFKSRDQPDQDDEYIGRTGISVSRVGDSEKLNQSMEILGEWFERIQKMEDGPSKDLLVQELERKAKMTEDSWDREKFE